MLRQLNVVFHFYVLEKHYANCKTTNSITRKITDVFRRTSEEKGEVDMQLVYTIRRWELDRSTEPYRSVWLFVFILAP